MRKLKIMKPSFCHSGKFFHCLMIALLLLAVVSCTDSKKKDAFVINEIMASNNTGLVAEDGKLHDWIEIKNVSTEPVSLKGFSLFVEKTASKKKAPKEGETEPEAWEFPDTIVAPGECLVVYMSKKGKKEAGENKSDQKDEKEKKGNKEKKDKKNKNDNKGAKGSTGELHATFKLPSSGGKVKLMIGDEVVAEVVYGELEDDQCYRRIADSTYEASYEPTPEFENTLEGYEKYSAAVEKQRKGPLRLWEMHSTGFKMGNAWIEVKNVSDEPVNLQEYCLTTSKKDMSRWTFPEVQLQPGAVYVVDCKKAEFKVSGEKSVMLTKNDEFVDGICGKSAPYGVSVGRVEGKDGMFYFPTPTRGQENDSPCYRTMAQEPSFDPTPGVYPEKKKLKVIIDSRGRTVHYTTDGSLPTLESPIYKDSICIDTTTTIRAFCEGDSVSMYSKTVTNTYILGDHPTFPVFNITVNRSDLYDYHRGIYQAGPGAKKEFPHTGANYWKKWWKNAHVEYFDSVNGGFSEDCELAIFGGFSRALPKKSFKIRFRDYRGPSSLKYDLYEEGEPIKVKNFVLRSGSQDISGVMVRDEFFTSLMKQNSPSLLVQAYKPVVLYINGEYFGLYYIREKIDKHFVARHLNVSNDSVSIIMSGMYCEEGTKKDFQDLMTYVRTHDLSDQENYEYMKTRIDINGLIDYKLGQMYSCNADAGNVRYVRSTDRKSDKKWHVVFYDLDATWATHIPASFYFGVSGSMAEGSVSRHNIMVTKMLKNKEFRQLFMERLSMHMHKTFSTENTTKVFDNLINTIKPEMPHNCERWANIMSYKKWESKVAAFREKFKERNKVMLNDLRVELAITPEEEKKYFSDLGF